ncbi:MAG TPA: SdiA-regulated domain-containing protein [Bacteroidales bacterium]|jgi:hypothetical protein|nr:SdiA-regulated domain-containing protein [Bacteroidales bacterium]
MISILLSIMLGCTVPQENPLGYDFSSPDATYVLPDTLREVSGLAWIGGSSFACIQDENGILFIYDVNLKKLTNQYTFHIDGDYEGIARTGNSVYVLRSDGVLFQVSNFAFADFRLNTWDTGIPAEDNEGLCYDRKNNRLLIGCKSKIGKGPEFKDKRVIYGFDLNTKKLTSEPVYEFDINALKRFALQNRISLPEKDKKKGEDEQLLKLRISAIGIHPLTGRLFLLSATDYMMFVFDSNGKIEQMERLDHRMFNKAEGISFFDNGDILITNEAQSKVPTLLRFNYEVR